MTKEQLYERIKNFADAGNKVYAYYVTYRVHYNIKRQDWGTIARVEDFREMLDLIGQNDSCIQGQLPIERLIVYAQEQCLVFVENHLWDCANDCEEYSHSEVVVPYIDKTGNFGTIKCNQHD